MWTRREDAIFQSAASLSQTQWNKHFTTLLVRKIAQIKSIALFQQFQHLELTYSIPLPRNGTILISPVFRSYEFLLNQISLICGKDILVRDSLKNRNLSSWIQESIFLILKIFTLYHGLFHLHQIFFLILLLHI